METTANERTIVERLFSLSEPMENRPVIVRRNTTPTLVKFLRSSDLSVALIAARTLRNLADHPDNGVYLCHERGFLPSIYEAFIQSRDNPALEPLHGVLTDVFEALRPALKADVEQRPYADGASALLAASRTARVLRSAQAAYSLTLKIVTISENNNGTTTATNTTTATATADLDSVLRVIRGIVSYVFDSENGEVRLFLSTPTETVLNILRNHGYAATVVSVDCVLGEVNADGPPVKGGGGAAGDENISASTPRGAVNSSYWRSGLKALSALKQAVVINEDLSLAARVARMKEDERRASMHGGGGRSHIVGLMYDLLSSWW